MARHGIKGRQLNRSTHQRKALFKGLLNSLIEQEEIQTTNAKAKAIQGVFDKLVAKSKLGTIHVRRLLHAFLGDQKTVSKLVDDIAPRMKERPSGFTRIVKLGLRRGDNAQLVKMSLVELKPVEVAKPEKPAKKTAPKKTK